MEYQTKCRYLLVSRDELGKSRDKKVEDTINCFTVQTWIEWKFLSLPDLFSIFYH